MSVTVYLRVKRELLTVQQQEQVVELVLRCLDATGTDVSVHAIGDCRMRTLNGRYRKKHKTTDVLSFPTEAYESGDAGDIFISVPQIIRQARSLKVSEKEEYARMLVHGVLHLFGYDHVTKQEEKEMFGLQETLLIKAKKKIL